MAFTESSVIESQKWVIYVDEASSLTGSGESITLESREGALIEVSFSLSFPTSKNQEEYEAFLVIFPRPSIEAPARVTDINTIGEATC